MFDKKDFELIPYSDNISYSKNINTFNKNLIINISETIKNVVDHSGAILMHECSNFQDFIGRDIDTFYPSKNKFLNINTEENLFFHERENGSYRFLINDINSVDFFNLDIEDLNIFSPNTKSLNISNIQTSFVCDKTGLKHFEKKAIIFYKLVKYFSYGIIFSYEQLFKLKKILNSLKIEELNYILDLTSKHLPKEHYYIKKLLEKNFYDFENDIKVKKFWTDKRIIRQNKRKVFAGDLKLKNLLKSMKFIYALLMGSFARWPKTHKPLPAIAIIGNDGAGKTSLCEYVVKNYSKMDPAYLNMKSDVPFFPFTKYINKTIKKILNISMINKIYPIKIFFKFLGQLFDIFDQYIKYKIGMAFADSGYGITIFERYITDKLRGEFPNKSNRFLPLEQFFPLPDGMFYLDVEPRISLKRKINDNHTLEEMTSKRKNYISLLEEFSEVKKVSFDNSFLENIKAFKNYIFELTIKKQKKIISASIVKRCVWKKNRNRFLAGNPKERFQKDSFL
tara:strand:- start:1215 stop:2738 length:1524 start_codon:yes stop_codon:yes gene_type:complete